MFDICNLFLSCSYETLQTSPLLLGNFLQNKNGNGSRPDGEQSDEKEACLLLCFSPNHAYHHHFSHEFPILLVQLWLLQHDTYAGEWVKLNIIILILSLHFIPKSNQNSFYLSSILPREREQKDLQKYGPCHIPILPYFFAVLSLIHYHPLSLLQCIINFRYSFCVTNHST